MNTMAAQYSAWPFEARPLAPKLGAELIGVDLAAEVSADVALIVKGS